MTRTAFYILIATAAFWGACRISEVLLYNSCQADEIELGYLNVKLANARKLNVFNAQLLRQLVIASHTDPILADLLARHHVKVVVTPGQQDASAPTNLAAPVAPGSINPASPEAPLKP